MLKKIKLLIAPFCLLNLVLNATPFDNNFENNLITSSYSIKNFNQSSLTGYKKYINCFSPDVFNFIKHIKMLDNAKSNIQNNDLIRLNTNLLITGKKETDKLLLGKIIASNLDNDLYSISFPDFLSEFQENSPNNIFTLFNQINNKAQKSLLFFDNIDLIEDNSHDSFSENTFKLSINKLHQQLENKQLNNLIIIATSQKANLPLNLKKYAWAKIINLKKQNNKEKKIFLKNILEDANLKIDKAKLELIIQKTEGLYQSHIHKILLKIIETAYLNSKIISEEEINNIINDFQEQDLNMIDLDVNQNYKYNFKKLTIFPKVNFFDCGYNAFATSLFINNFINDKNFSRLLNDSIIEDGYRNKDSEFKSTIISRRYKNLIYRILYNILLTNIKGATLTYNAEDSHPLKFEKGFIKYNPLKESGWFSSGEGDNNERKKLINISNINHIALAVANNLETNNQKSVVASNEQIYDEFIKVSSLDKSLIKKYLNLKDVTFTINEDNSISYSIGENYITTLTNKEISEEFKIENYLEGRSLNEQEMKFLINIYLSQSSINEMRIMSKSLVIVKLDDIEQKSIRQCNPKLDTILKEISDIHLSKMFSLILINNNHWATLVIHKKENNIEYLFADSTNSINIDKFIQKLTATISNYIKCNQEPTKHRQGTLLSKDFDSFYFAKLNCFKESFHEPKVKFSSLNKNLNDDLKEIIEELAAEFTTKFKNKSSGSVCSNLLLYGEPGNGKTTIAEAIANRLNRLFIKVSISEIVNSYKSSGSSSINALFDAANMQSRPVVICIDEIDSLANASSSNSNDCDQVETALINKINQIEELNSKEYKVIVIATTNYPDNLLDSLKSRFEKIHVNFPDTKQRKNIIKHLLKEVQHNISDQYIDQLAEKTKNWSIRDLKCLHNKASRMRIITLMCMIKKQFIDENNIPRELEYISKNNFEEAYSKMLIKINEKNNPINIYNKFHQQNKKLLDNIARDYPGYRDDIGRRILRKIIYKHTRKEGIVDNKDISEILDNDY